MTDFATELRHRCRNPRCRSKLPAPVANPREAFCARGCHTSFYRNRCVICEGAMERKSEHQLVCGKRRCRNALQARIGLGRYHAPPDAVSPLRNAAKPGIKSGDATDRPWRIVAGPEQSPSAFHCAAVGATEAVEAIDRTNARHWREHNAKAHIQRHHAPVNIVGGYKFPGAPNIDLSPIAPAPAPTDEYAWSSWQPYPSVWRPIVDRPVEPPSPDDLSIPQFLRRACPRACARPQP